MADDEQDMIGLIKEMAAGPKRDNSAYHRVMSEARQAFEDAEIALGGPVRAKLKTKIKSNGTYTVKWIFKRLS